MPQEPVGVTVCRFGLVKTQKRPTRGESLLRAWVGNSERPVWVCPWRARSAVSSNTASSGTLRLPMRGQQVLGLADDASKTICGGCNVADQTDRLGHGGGQLSPAAQPNGAELIGCSMPRARVSCVCIGSYGTACESCGAQRRRHQRRPVVAAVACPGRRPRLAIYER